MNNTVIVLGEGVLSWPNMERVSGRYGVVDLQREPDSDTYILFEDVTAPRRGSLVAVVLDVLNERPFESHHGLPPMREQRPAVNEAVTLGAGTLFTEKFDSMHGEWPGRILAGVRPDDGRGEYDEWLDTKQLYRVKGQRVRLEFHPDPVETARPARVTYGDIRMGFHAVAYGLTGQPINGGQLYADRWDSPEELRVWAVTLFRSTEYRIGHVTIDGREMRFAGHAWESTGKHCTHERIERDRPVELTAADKRLACYDTCMMDYPETVHERRSDGSCACGKHPSRFPPVAPAIDTGTVHAALGAYAVKDKASADDKPAAEQAYAQARGALTIPDRAELDHLILDYLCGRAGPLTASPRD